MDILNINMDILNKRWGLRSRLQQEQYRQCETAIPKEAVTPETEPDIFRVLQDLARYIVEHPESILLDVYSLEDRQKDWQSLCECVPNLDSRSRPGHKLLDHHMPHFWDVRSWKGVSVRSLITQANLEKALLLNLRMHSTPYKSEIRRTLVLSGGLSNVTKYRASMSKYIVTRYGASTVLDPCIGWGGRMLGSLSAGAHYTGCEPDPQTFQGLAGMLKDIGRPADLYNEPAERVLPRLRQHYDLVLTSPPYYNLELYTAGEQSIVTFPSWEEWVKDWLKPVVLNCLRCLKHTGKSCWSVKNFKTDKKYPLADVVEQIHREQGWNCIEVITLTGPGRPGAHRDSEEQTFVYSKQTE